jgi:hypothetical protein
MSLLDPDARRIADARVWADVSPSSDWDLSAEYLHAEPALLLSRQSVLAVFSTAAYEEVGARVAYRPLSVLELAGEGMVELYDVGHPGTRSELAARLTPTRDRATSVRIGYGRVVAPDNGYHALRASLSGRFVHELRGTLDAFGYFYDHPIESVPTSTVLSGTLTWQATPALGVLLGGSLARSPYALSDAQAQLRAVYAFEASAAGGAR